MKFIKVLKCKVFGHDYSSPALRNEPFVKDGDLIENLITYSTLTCVDCGHVYHQSLKLADTLRSYK